MIDDLKASYNGIKANLLEAADKMPEGNYALHPGTQPRTFGGWVGHTADAQMGTCSGIAGAPKNLNAEKEKTSKADLIAALKESFDACDPIFNGTTDANANEGVRSFRGTVPRVSALYGMVIHSNECYGAMAVYMRITEVDASVQQRRSRGAAARDAVKDFTG